MAKREVWWPADYGRSDARAIQALAQYARLAEVAWNPETMGPPPTVPSPFEVKKAMDWIIHAAAQTYDNGTAASLTSNDPNGRIAAFVDGRRSVGDQIIKLTKIKIDSIRED